MAPDFERHRSVALSGDTSPSDNLVAFCKGVVRGDRSGRAAEVDYQSATRGSYRRASHPVRCQSAVARTGLRADAPSAPAAGDGGRHRLPFRHERDRDGEVRTVWKSMRVADRKGRYGSSKTLTLYRRSRAAAGATRESRCWLYPCAMPSSAADSFSALTRRSTTVKISSRGTSCLRASRTVLVAM
jgi:hypothetical protein